MITVSPIGYALNKKTEIEDDFWGEVLTEIIILDEIPEDSLDGIEAFSHLEIIFYFHKASKSKVICGSRHPRNDPGLPKVGIFAQRGKNRPNHLGLTTVQLFKREGRQLTVKGLDCINGTPILDIKPVMEEFLPREPVKQADWTRDIMKDYWS